MIVGKVWGTTEPLLVTPLLEIHRLHLKRRAHCSMHKHERKVNGFICLSGRLIIEVEQTDYPLLDTTVLEPGQMTQVKPDLFHRFRTDGKDTVALEFYYPAAMSEDIVRRDHGGDDEHPARLVSGMERANNRDRGVGTKRGTGVVRGGARSVSRRRG